MAYEQRDNSGSLFKNDRKEQDNHPDYAGTIMVDGVEYWLNGWQKKNTRDGTTFYSLSVKPKEARQDAQNVPANPGFSGGVETDDIPF